MFFFVVWRSFSWKTLNSHFIYRMTANIKKKKKKNLPPVSLVYYLVVIVKVLRKKTYEEALYCDPSMISAGFAAICRWNIIDWTQDRWYMIHQLRMRKCFKGFRSLKDWASSELNVSARELFNVCHSSAEEFDPSSLFDVRKRMILCVTRLRGWQLPV